MIKSLIKKGATAAREVKRVARGFVQGPQGPGYGVSEYSDFERIRAEAAAQDRAEGIVCSGEEMDAIADGTVELSAEDLRVMLEIEEGDDLPQLVDVREAHERAEGGLPGSLHVPLAELDDRTDELDRSRRVVVYADAGSRGIDASYVLKHAGFPRVSCLAGGVEAWTGAGNALEPA